MGHLNDCFYYIYSGYFPDEHIGLARFFLVIVRVKIFEVAQNQNFFQA